MKPKNLIRKTLCATLISGCLMSGSTWAGGIPTADIPVLKQAIRQVQQGKEQIEKLVESINQLKSQVKALTSQNGYGNIKAQVKDAFDSEWKDFYSDFAKQDTKNLTSAKNYDPNNFKKTMEQQFEMMSRAAKDSQNRLDNLSRMINEVNKTQDAKAAADLANRISIENGIIAQNQANVTNMLKMVEMQKEAQREQARNAMHCGIAKQAGVDAHGC